MKEGREFRDALATLRAFCPTDLPVRVRRKRIAEDYGWCSKKPKTYEVVVNSELPESMQVLVLIHEYSHAMAWRWEHELDKTHSAHWGICYAQAYCAVFDMAI